MVVLWGPVLGWLALIFYLSSVNTWTLIDGPPLVQALRKCGHVIEYAVLALLLGRAMAGTMSLRGEALTRAVLARIWWLGAAFSTLYAVTDELHQGLVPRREFHIGDILIDALSATAALGIWYITRTQGSKSRTHHLEQH